MNGAWILLVVIAGIAVTTVASRRDLQAPLVLVAVGALVSFVPGLPRLELDPEIILGVVLPPLLYSSALRFSVPTFRQYLPSILRLGIYTVLVTAFVVAWTASAMMTALTFGAALALGAVVAPTDAVSAVAVGQRLGLPKRVIAVLTGEGLVNDATALTLFTVAISAVTGTHILADSPVLFFLYEVAGGVAVGLVLAYIVHLIRARMYDSPLETVLGLVLPFAAYLAAEEIHASGVLAVVAAGLFLGHRATEVSVSTRLQERAVWKSVDVVLKTFVFAYMGLQFRFVLDDVRDSGTDLHVALLGAVVILLVVMFVRPAWGLLHWGRRALVRRAGSERLGRDQLNFREHVVVSWAGMRGVVTLAAAGGVPVVIASGADFPGREMIQISALVVAIGTLLIQGATMPWLIRRLDVTDPYERLRTEEQLAVARRISAESSDRVLGELAAYPPDGVDPEIYDKLLSRARKSLHSRQEAETVEDAAEDAGARLAALFDDIRRASLRARRQALIDARDRGELDDEILRDVLESLDVDEAAVEERIRRRRRDDSAQR
ncbi:Na+/H+ antiporter [Rhodococcus sp. B50]|uniref:Na+/H+ antiporter n=1 Tax=Rhodococcus sp. B50 TaxID=2682847 RepID=UPI001BD50B97|nr:Na+/H+ antiporter [Rhodococcus sp. B50]MBS9373658.1 Sodium, potassium, lithium and rubidium/H(+) antiporter [Rhodococcus sp. B50]